MVTYRVNENGHLIPVSEKIGERCPEWGYREDGDRFIFYCLTNPSLEKVYRRDEVIILE